MKIVGSIEPGDVPNVGVARFGVWTRLADQVIQAYREGKVLVVTAENHEEAKRMTNGMAERLRLAGYSRQFVRTEEPDGSVTVYCQLAEQQHSVVVQPLKRPRRRASG